MVIEPGSTWGEAVDRPHGLALASSDADAARLIGEGITTIGLTDGDLLTTMGGSRPAASATHRFDVDLGWVRLDGGPRRPFVAHVVARRRFWQGEAAVVMNAAWLGSLYLGPRAHPNDGLLDITNGSLPLNERIEARRRAQSGTHLPHPGLTSLRRPDWSHEFGRPTPVLVDGVPVGSATTIEVAVDVDAFTVVL